MRDKFNIRSVRYNFLMNIILKMSGVIFPLITFPYVSRVLLSAANGKIAFASSVVSYFSLIASMGIPSYGIRKCAEVRDDKNQLSKVVKELLILNSIFTLLAYLAFAMLLVLVPRFAEERLLFLITSMTILFNMLGVEWFYQAIEQYQYITVRNITFKILSILLMFLLVHQPEDYLTYAGINVLASVGSNLLNIMQLSKYVQLDFRKHQSYQLGIHLIPIITLFLYNATTIIFTSLDQVMLGFMSGDDSVGFYASAIKVKNILVSLITALGAVMLPKISYTLKNSGTEEFERLITKSFEFILVTAIPISFFFILSSKEIILVLAGVTYLPTVPILQFLMPSIIFIGLSSVTAWQLLIPLNKEKFTVVGAIIGAAVNVLVNILLIPKFDAVGAAIASSLAELSVLLTHLIVLKQVIQRTFELKELMLSFLSSLLAAGSVLILRPYLSVDIAFLDSLTYGSIFFGVYGILLIIGKEKLITSFFNQFKLKFNKGRK